MKAALAAALVALVSMPLVGSGVVQAAAVASPLQFSLTSSGARSIVLTPDTGLPPASGPVDASGSTNVVTQVTETNSGFSSSDMGAAQLECNDDPGQPSIAWPDPLGGSLPVPVSCDF